MQSIREILVIKISVKKEWYYLENAINEFQEVFGEYLSKVKTI